MYVHIFTVYTHCVMLNNNYNSGGIRAIWIDNRVATTPKRGILPQTLHSTRRAKKINACSQAA